jgi:carboxypeptidase D
MQFRPVPVPVVEDAHPHFRLIGNMHGNEYIGHEMPLHLIDLFAQTVVSANPNPELFWLLQNTFISIMPSLNPDGFEAQTRRNANGFDLNRNFPDRENLPNPPERQPETLAYMKWSLPASSFQASANLHGGALVVNYPFDHNIPMWTGEGTKYARCPDDSFYISYSSAYARAHPFMWNSTDFPGGITNGAKWWEITGCLQDWSYMVADDFDVTIELTEEYVAPADQILPEWQAHQKPLYTIMQQVHRGVRGRVVLGDGATNFQDIVVLVDGIDKPIHCTPNGYFYRLLSGGTYTIRFRLDGYADTVIENVVVPDGFTPYTTAMELPNIVVLTKLPSSSSSKDSSSNSDNRVTESAIFISVMLFVVFCGVGVYVARKRLWCCKRRQNSNFNKLEENNAEQL